MTALWTAGQPKLIWGDDRVVQVDVERDPEEKDRRPVEEHPQLELFEEQVAEYTAHLEGTKNDAPDEDALDALRELGYVE
jgi:hypothetical protein